MAYRVTDADRLALTIEYRDLASLIPNPNNLRRHTSKQIAKLCNVIREYGFTSPIVHDEGNMILAGHGRYEAAQRMKLAQAPCVCVPHLTAAQKKAFSIADNKMSDESTFDYEALRAELRELARVEFKMELTGFDTAEIDFILDGAAGTLIADPADQLSEPDPNQGVVSQTADLWRLGSHRLLCGSALEASAYQRLLGPDRAQMIFTDPPYNVPITGHVSGLGRRRHREFVMASGEMSKAKFRAFLATAIRQLAAFSTDGSIHYLCMDWRHVQTLLEAGEGIYAEVKNICVWNKTNAGMGSLYRSQHEFVVVFKNGSAPHQNNVELGKHGRYRTNVWDYPGANSFGPTRDADLAAHPTVKPVALVADAIRDCSKRGAIILDPFAGSGTILLAAERTGRRASAIEVEPRYVDTAIRRWQRVTGAPALLIIDDPHNASEAYLASAREAVKRYYRSTLRTRLNDQITGRIILVMQRLHEDDLAGHLLAQGGWEDLKLPAIAVEDAKYELGGGKVHWANAGDHLHSRRLPPAFLDEIRRDMGSAAFQAQYQQQPVPVDGNMIKREWLCYEDGALHPSSGPITLSLDTATKTDPIHDYSVCTVWLETEGKHHLIHVWRDKVDYPDLKSKIVDLVTIHHAQNLLIEDQGAGTSLIQELKKLGVPAIGRKTRDPKVARLAAASSYIEAGQMRLPKEASWLAEFEAELLGFPGARHDDQVDSLSQYFGWVRERPRSLFLYDMMQDENPPTHDTVAEHLLWIRGLR